jgi:methionine synthase I (cobalamin-dependent)
MTPLLEVLRSGRVLLMDGAMGTELQRVGLKPEENSAAWNFLHPERVRAVHEAYVAAGAEVLLSNTFLINADSLRVALQAAGHPWDARTAWRRALGCMPATVYHLAAVGPVSGYSAHRDFDDLSFFRLPEGLDCAEPEDPRFVPDAFLIETVSTRRVYLALDRLPRPHQRPVLLSLTFLRNEQGRLVTSSGYSPEWFARRARGYGADALGVNCGRDLGMDGIVEIVRRYRQETDLPLFARPNAGTPVRQEERWVYPHTPQNMAERLPELLEAGVSMVGGCCGTTPAHIAAFRQVVNDWNARRFPLAAK